MKAWLDSVLIPEWRRAWRLFSVQFALVLVLAPTAYESSAMLRDFIPVSAFHWIMGALAVLTILARLKAQLPPPEAPKPPAGDWGRAP